MAQGTNITGINSPESGDTNYVQKIIDSYDAVDDHDHSADKGLPVARIADSAVATLAIADGAVTTIKLATNAVTTVKITDANVTTTKIADSAVTTAKILDANVTKPKMGPLSQLLSSLIGTLGVFSTSSTTAVDITNATVTLPISSANRPVMIMLQSASTSPQVSRMRIQSSAGAISQAILVLYRDADPIATFLVFASANIISAYLPAGIQFVDTGATASTSPVYKLQAFTSSANDTFSIEYCKLIAWEL